MKLRKRKLFFPFMLIVLSIPILAVSSCNFRIKREVKDNKLPDSIWKSERWNTLEKMIQNKFKDKIIRDMFESYVYTNTIPKTRLEKKRDLSELTRANTTEDLQRSFLAKKKGRGNYGTDILKSVFNKIRDNKLIPVKYRHLLSQISTVYNRTINMYPTKLFHKEKDGDKYLHIQFRADLITPMKRRFVKKFTNLQFDFPIFKKEYSQLELRKYHKFDTILNKLKTIYANSESSAEEKKKALKSFAKKINTASLMHNIWLSTILYDKGIRQGGNGLIDENDKENLLGEKLLNLNAGLYPIINTTKDKTDLYQPKATGDLLKAPTKYEFANWVAGNTVFVVLNKSDKVSQLESKIKEYFFTKSKMPLFQALFGPEGDWNIKVSAQTWAGNSASNYTIADWVENIGHRGDFFFYMIHKKDPSQSLFFKKSAGMGKVREDV